MTAPLWADDVEIARRWGEEPDPERHDVPDLCICTHDREDHTRSDGCVWRDCPCPWFDPDDGPEWTDRDEYEEWDR